MKFRDRTGERIGRFTVVRRAPNQGKHVTWKCRCDCGKIRFVPSSLLGSKTRSCGCLRRALLSARTTKHGKARLPEYFVWHAMIRRCHDPRHNAYQRYGGAGIVVCAEWRRSIVAFLRDMGRRPSPKHTLDRIDSNGPYSPANCRWATRAMQARNKANNTWISLDGERMIMADWAKRLGMPRSNLIWRLRHWPLARALTQPFKKRQ